MNLGLVEKIADAVLYEGYILYPYRPSAVKNRQRFNFGALCPAAYSRAQGGTEASAMQTECLCEGGAGVTLDVKVRFLHLTAREVCVAVADRDQRIADSSDAEIQSSIKDSELRVVPSLEVNGRLFQAWQESVERAVCLPELNLSETVARPLRQTFAFPESREVEPLRDGASGELAGVIVRRREAVEGAVEVSAERADGGAFKIKVRILNLTPLEDAGARSRDEALTRSLVSTHTILSVRGGAFVSLLETPEAFREAAAGCQNVGTYPVLAGEEGERCHVLSSPIILYDYPKIAPESAGDLFDGTEIDEILTLRIMTLTDEEKREACAADEFARRILERTEGMPAEQLMKMHGTIKKVQGSKFKV
jgi:hydrogenase maturation protease